MNTIKFYTLDQIQDKLIGEKGTPEHNKFEHELQIDLIGKVIHQPRQGHHLTQEELERLIVVQRAQVF